jgi:hypothetical protein
MSLKNPVTPPGIDPGTVRLVEQRLNYDAIPGSSLYRGADKSLSRPDRKHATATKDFDVYIAYL